MNPYIDEGQIRTFDPNVDSHELVWHRDREDRIVTVLEGRGWSFQADDCLPVELERGDVFRIPKMSYHRILKGTSPLRLHILKAVNVS